MCNFLCPICWGGSIRASDTKKLNKVIKKVGYLLGNALEALELVVERGMLQKLLNIMDNTSNPLHDLPVREQRVQSSKAPSALM